MTSCVEEIRERVNLGCVVQGNLVKGNCTVFLDSSPHKCISIDFDHKDNPLGTKVTRCDFLYVAEHQGMVYVALLELTTDSDKEVSKVLQQLQAGAECAQTLVPKGTRVCFTAHLVSTRLRKERYRNFRDSKCKVNFYQYRTRIKLSDCGMLLSEIVDFGST